MPSTRRRFLRASAMCAAAGLWPARGAPSPSRPMFGLIGKMTAVSGQRDALTAILVEGTSAMPGCLSYVVAHDRADPDAIWITEVWDSAESHRASLSLPSVRQAIARGRPLIAGFGPSTETVPAGGHGLGHAA